MSLWTSLAKTWPSELESVHSVGRHSGSRAMIFFSAWSTLIISSVQESVGGLWGPHRIENFQDEIASRLKGSSYDEWP